MITFGSLFAGDSPVMWRVVGGQFLAKVFGGFIRALLLHKPKGLNNEK